MLNAALARAEAQIARLRTSGWKLSRNDIGVVVMAQVVAQVSRGNDRQAPERVFEEIEGAIAGAIDQLQDWNCKAAQA